MRNFELPGKSVMYANNGMASTSHPYATSTALSVLKKGGNAMDAAIAACAVQCVVEPQSTGIGGDCFVLYAQGGSDNVIAYNGSGKTPAALNIEWFENNGIQKIESNTPHAVTVPGAVNAWTTLLADYGTRDLGEILEYAIYYAENGYPVLPRVAYDWNLSINNLTKDSNTKKLFTHDGKALKAGDIHIQKKLAETLKCISNNGRDGFYKGAVAEDIVEYLNSIGGVHTLKDFAESFGEYVEPIKGSYNNYDVFECPPNGQGIIALIILNMISSIGIKNDDPLSLNRLHTFIEASRLAYNDRDLFVCDPLFNSVPVEWLLSGKHTRDLVNLINDDFAIKDELPHSFPMGESTVYITVVDKDRNSCSLINSIFSAFGSGLTSPGSGVLLQNRGTGFSLDPKHPNCIAPCKRPLHTIIPGMLTKNGKTVMSFGVMGGHYQAMGQAYFLSNILDFKLDIQEAIDLPRVFPKGKGNDVEFESGIPEKIKIELEKKGHNPVIPVKPVGGAQAIMIDWEKNVLLGGSDSRKDGCALGY